MVRAYIPKQGDIVWISFDPQKGHEQKGRRPALVVSDKRFNAATKMSMLCPITNTDRSFPFHVPLQAGSISGFVMTEQLKSLDIEARNIEFIEAVDSVVLEEVLDIVNVVIFDG